MNQTKKKGFSRLIELTGKYKILLIIGCILSGISAILTLGPYISIYLIIKEILAVGGNMTLVNTSLLIDYGWLALILAISGIIMNFLALMCSHIVAFKTIKNVRFDLLKHLATLSLGFHTLNPSGRIRKILESNTGQLEDFIAHRIPDLVASIVSPIMIVVLLLFFDWRLGLISLIPLILGFGIQIYMMSGDKQEKWLRIYQESLEDMNNSAVEYVRGISVVKVFGQTVHSFKNFYKSIIQYKDFVVKYTLSLEKPMSLFVTIINGTFLFLIPAGIILVNYASNFEAFVLSFIFYVIFTPVATSMLMKILYVASDQMVIGENIRKIDELFNTKPLPETKNPQYPKNFDVKFKNVDFSYDQINNDKLLTKSKEKDYAIKDISLNVHEGEIIALVGASGSGKSTIANLIPRFWDVDSGSIEIGGVNIKNIATKDLMDYISIVFQDTHIFKDSILENIKFGNPDASREQIINAAKLAQCEDILEKMPNGIDTIIGTKGVYLSGGEKQRISIARTILKNSPIIIFDEATAFADPENEYKIQLALKELTKNKTVIMIAHRLSSIKNVDKILVMEKGEIIESGVHDELIKEEGIYSKMWKEYNSGLLWNVSKNKDSGSNENLDENYNYDYNEFPDEENGKKNKPNVFDQINKDVNPDV